jgi:hypothetical protein
MPCETPLPLALVMEEEGTEEEKMEEEKVVGRIPNLLRAAGCPKCCVG